MNKKKVIWISALSAVGVLAAAYGIGCGFYSSHLMPHTSINGTAVGNDSASKAASALASSQGKVITLAERDDKTETISLDDIAYQADVSTWFPRFNDRDTEARKAYKDEVANSREYRDDIYMLDILREGIRNDDPRIQRIILK